MNRYVIKNVGDPGLGRIARYISPDQWSGWGWAEHQREAIFFETRDAAEFFLLFLLDWEDKFIFKTDFHVLKIRERNT